MNFLFKLFCGYFSNKSERPLEGSTPPTRVPTYAMPMKKWKTLQDLTGRTKLKELQEKLEWLELELDLANAWERELMQ